MSVTNIGIFGKRNTGKSSIINIFLGQDFAIVSDKPGTTTDPVKKRIEIFGVGPSLMIDTAGIDDFGELGKKRVEKTKELLAQIDIALIVFTANNFSKMEKDLLSQLKKNEIPTILVHNQSDIIPMDEAVAQELAEQYGVDVVEFSCNILDEERQKEAVSMLTSFIVKAASGIKYKESAIFEGLIEKDSTIVLVCPIDSEAPTGRLILPQVMAIRDIQDNNAVAVVLQPDSLRRYLEQHPAPTLIVTDSQVFGKVAEIVPQDIPLTSFSMLLARSKGCFNHYVKGTFFISELKDGDRVLILESCTHHSSCEDIGRVKLPALFRKFTGKRLEFDIVAGLDRIERNITEYALVAQCGGCMITGRQLYSRLSPAIENNIPVTNYGMAIAYMSGIFERSLKPLK